MKEALFWYALPEGKVQCLLCPHRCTIAPGGRGFCRSRVNRGGTLYADSYGVVTACHIDPIEKKPLYHFNPGTSVLSVGTYGCNLRCDFCQNYSISQAERPDVDQSAPEDIVSMAKGTDGIAFTYSEPVTWIEFVSDVCDICSLPRIIVSNGYILPDPLSHIIERIDAANIDVKGGSGFYKKLCHSPYHDSLETVGALYDAGVHVEATTLVIDGHNTEDGWLSDMCRRLADISPDIPLHLSRFFPHYKMMSAQQTKLESLENASRIARDAGVRYVYIGNVGGADLDTRCPSCGSTVVSRSWSGSVSYVGANGKCTQCGADIYGTW